MQFRLWFEALELSSGVWQPKAYQLAQQKDTRAQQQHNIKLQAIKDIQTAIKELQTISNAVTPQQKQIQISMGPAQLVKKAHESLKSIFQGYPDAAQLMQNLDGAVRQWNQSIQYGNVENLIAGLNLILRNFLGKSDLIPKVT